MRSGLAGIAYLVFGEAYRRTRFVDSFLDPWNDPQGSGFQLIQGMIALGSGGWTGVGLGASRQKWDYLPNAHSDFIFAIIGEELGLLGALFVLAMFVLMIFAGIRIAMRRAGHLRPAPSRRGDRLDRSAGHGEPRCGDRSAAHHRRSAAARLVRWDRVGRDACGHRGAGKRGASQAGRPRHARVPPRHYPRPSGGGAQGEPMNVVITGGGTAGHVFPAIALADRLAADGDAVSFVGSPTGQEAVRVPAAGYPFHAVDATP